MQHSCSVRAPEYCHERRLRLSHQSARNCQCRLASEGTGGHRGLRSFPAGFPGLGSRLSDRGSMSVVQEALVEFWRHTGDRISRNKASVLAGHEAVFGKHIWSHSDPALKRDVRASHEMRLAISSAPIYSSPPRAIGHACRGLVLGPSRDRWWHFRSVIKHVIKNSMRPARSKAHARGWHAGGVAPRRELRVFRQALLATVTMSAQSRYLLSQREDVDGRDRQSHNNCGCSSAPHGNQLRATGRLTAPISAPSGHHSMSWPDLVRPSMTFCPVEILGWGRRELRL